jgi:hypothetical protein
MNNSEREEISKLPDKYKPLGAWAYFGYSILFAIPVLGFICLVIFSLSSGNINRRSFARSYFCGLVLIVIVYLILAFAVGIDFAAIYDMFKNMA